MKNYIKTLGTVVLAGTIVLGMGTSVGAKGPQNVKAEKEVKEVQTGRTAQARVVDAITVNDVTVAERYATSVPLYGTVTIDGPELHLTINGNPVETVKVGDKTWEYHINGDIRTVNEDNNALFTIEAHTYYSDGQPYGQVHTSATTVVKEVHVPYVTLVTAENPVWGEYDAETNTFPLTYDLRSAWSDEGEDEVESGITVYVDADLEIYTVESTETTFDIPAKPVLEIVATEFVDLKVIFDTQNQHQWKVVTTYTIVYSNGHRELATVERVVRKTEHQNGQHILKLTLTEDDVIMTIIINGATQTATDENGNPIVVEFK